MAWVRMGEGNVGIDDYVRKYAERCPGRALSLEIIVTGARTFAIHDPTFWEGYRKTPAWEFARFLAIANRGTPRPTLPPVPREQAAGWEREDLEAGLRYTKGLLGQA